MELVVKTLTRHRDPGSDLYLKDWTAGDILMIGEDGTLHHHLSDQMRKMNLLITIPGTVPQDIIWNKFNDDRDNGNTYRDLAYRCSHIVDLKSLLSNKELQDCFNHDKPVQTKHLPGHSHLDVIKPQATRTGLITEYDLHGSVTAGTYTVGSGGDYASFAAAESDTADLTGDLTFNGFDTSTDTTPVVITGFAFNGYTLTFGTSGDGNHNGVIGAGYKHRVNSTQAWTINRSSANVLFKGLDIRNNSTTVDTLCIRLTLAVTFSLDSCFVGFASRNSGQAAIYYTTGTGPTINVTNCVGYDCYRAFIANYLAYASVVNINSSTFFNIGFSAVATSISGIVGHYMAFTAGTTIQAFNNLCYMHTGAPFTKNDVPGTLHVDRCITNASAWHTYIINTDTDNILSATFQDTVPSADCVYWKEDSINPYDLRLESDSTYNIAQDAHADGSGVNLTMPSLDIAGTLRPQNTNYDIGAFEVAEVVESAVSIATSIVRSIIRPIVRPIIG